MPQSLIVVSLISGCQWSCAFPSLSAACRRAFYAGQQIRRASRTPAAHHAVMNFNKNIGMLLLAVYLIVVGIVGLTGIGPGILLPILALITGVLILIGK